MNIHKFGRDPPKFPKSRETSLSLYIANPSLYISSGALFTIRHHPKLYIILIVDWGGGLSFHKWEFREFENVQVARFRSIESIASSSQILERHDVHSLPSSTRAIASTSPTQSLLISQLPCPSRPIRRIPPLAPGRQSHCSHRSNSHSQSHCPVSGLDSWARDDRT